MKKLLIIIGIVPAVSILGALFTEYVLRIGVLGSQNLKYFFIAGIVAAIAAFVVSKRWSRTFAAQVSFAVPVLLGFLLIPYAVFLVGQIDIYMVDDNLLQGMAVVEVRPVMDKITFGTPDKGEVAVWKGPETLRLYPGENRVRLGRFAMEAGTYQGGTVYISDIQVDIQADLSAMKNPVSGESIPPDQYASVFEIIKSQMTGSVAGFTIHLDNASLSGSTGTFTIRVGQMTLPIPIPEIKYPGVGGPDVTVDIVLDEMGRPDPSKIKTIIEMPPGVGGAFPQMPGVEFR